MTIFRSRAPLRVSFAGGGTDVPPYPEERGGAVLSVTIDKYTYASLVQSSDDKDEPFTVTSLDYDIIAKYDSKADLIFNGELDLVKATLKNMGLPETGHLFLHSDAPPGSGLGSSSTMCVTLVGLLKEWKKLPMTDYDIAEKAIEIERHEVGIPGGLQDQYAATFGGFNYIEFHGDKTVVNPLKIKRSVLNELEYHLLLCYTGSTRLSANIIIEQVGRFKDKKKATVTALDENKRLASEMKNALLRGELDQFGEILHEAWMHKKNYSSKMTSPEIDKLYETAREYGAVGGKLLGAGGGGYLLLYCNFDKRHIIARELEALGGQVVGFSFDFKGLQTWGIPAKVGK